LKIVLTSIDNKLQVAERFEAVRIVHLLKTFPALCGIRWLINVLTRIPPLVPTIRWLSPVGN